MRRTRTLYPNEYLGCGIYTVPEAARLTRVSPQSIRRWLLGYQSNSSGHSRMQPPVISHDYAPIDGEIALSFLDLIQVRFVDAFRSYGVSLQEIRKAATIAAELVQDTHPFATKLFYTDKRSILARITKEGKDPELLSLVRRQYEIDEVVLPLLYEGIEFSESAVADKWWPMGMGSKVVLDPERNLGKPILHDSGVATETLSQSYLRLGSYERVAHWYELSADDVRVAVEFEGMYAA